MQPLWAEEASDAIGEIARRHGFDEQAGHAMADALVASAGHMAQFSHPDLGGMGQWSRGGMLMIGDMFNNGLKARVASLAEDLAQAMDHGLIVARRPAYGESSMGFSQWWPEELGVPSSTGAQNGRRYAVFPTERRLAIERDGRVRVYDTGDYRIGGAGQQQGGTESLTFSTDRGSIGVENLNEIGAPTRVDPQRQSKAAQDLSFGEAKVPSEALLDSAPAPRKQTSEPHHADAAVSRPDPVGGDPIELIRKLAALKDAGVLTDEEFTAKKTELLARI